MQPLDLKTARQILDFSGGDSTMKALGDLQLKGAVALHNMLADEGVGIGYLADEVGMGKTYVALGVVALMRYFNPSLRVLYICPSRNVQEKWYAREQPNFIRKNVRTNHFRLRTLRGESGTPAISCNSIEDLINAASTGYFGDIFVRMSSFSMAMTEDDGVIRKRLEWLRERVPASLLRGAENNKRSVKQYYAKAVNYLLPEFDLVVIDEAHNFKHDFQSSARNVALSQILGVNAGHRDNRRKARSALLLSATPFDLNPRHLYNQLALVGCEHLMPEEEEWDNPTVLRNSLAKFMVRRLNELLINGVPHTRNMYRLEARKGERAEIEFSTDEHKLITALVQKQVGESLTNNGSSPSFQMGLLASFESYAQTAKSGPVEFDGDPVQKEKNDAKDRHVIGIIRDSYVEEEKLGSSLPHPKMDQLSEELAFEAYGLAKKQLVFVRRVRSVGELKNKLDEHYNNWLQKHILSELDGSPESYGLMGEIIQRYSEVSRRLDDDISGGDAVASIDEESERIPPKNDTLFNWYFRGDTPEGLITSLPKKYSTWVTPDQLRKSLVARNNANILIFEINWAKLVCENCLDETISTILDKSDDSFWQRVQSEMQPVPEGDRLSLFLSVQQAYLKVVQNDNRQLIGLNELSDYLSHLIQSGEYKPSSSAIIRENLSQQTVFCLLKKSSMLRSCFDRYLGLFRRIKNRVPDLYDEIHRIEIHRQLVAQTFRTGHAWVDLYLSRLKIGESQLNEERRQRWLAELVACLERQSYEEGFSSYIELFNLNQCLDLIIKSNLPGAHHKTPKELRLWLNQMLPSSAPIIGATGETYTGRSVQARKFRMPGYPLILVSTDVFQEGEDLHTFCDSVVHYGLSSSPTGIEQKTGRVDRVGAMAHRRLQKVTTPNPNKDFIQVRFPFVKQSIESLQVRKLCFNLNQYIASLHEIGGGTATIDDFIDTSRELLSREEIPNQLFDFLESPYVPSIPNNVGDEYLNIIKNEGDKISSATAHVHKLINEFAESPLNARGHAYVQVGQANNKRLDVELTSAKATSDLLVRATAEGQLDFRRVSEWDHSSITEFQSNWYETDLTRVTANFEKDGIALYQDAEMLVGDADVSCKKDFEGLFGRFSSKFEDEEYYLLYGEDLPDIDDGEVSDYLTAQYAWSGKFRSKSNSNGTKFTFQFDNDRQRRHIISLTTIGKYCCFEAIVADEKHVNGLSSERLIMLTWQRNRNTDLVEFIVRPDGYLVGRTFHPSESMGFEECVYSAYVLAVEADRLEYIVKEPDGVLGFFRPKTTIIAESPAIRGLQEGIAFSEVHIYTNFG